MKFAPDFIINDCTLELITQRVLDECNPFSCGEDDDMDDFFRREALTFTKFQMGKSYCFRLDADPKQIIACFTVSNDSLRIYDLPSSRRNAMWGITNREKMLTRYPGILIGRLAVAEGYHGIGTQIMRFLKQWLDEEEDKTASRFLIVDAKNQPKVLDYYLRNGFNFLFSSELQEDIYTKPPRSEEEKQERMQNPRQLHTRLMYFDLINMDSLLFTAKEKQILPLPTYVRGGIFCFFAGALPRRVFQQGVVG